MKTEFDREGNKLCINLYVRKLELHFPLKDYRILRQNVVYILGRFLVHLALVMQFAAIIIKISRRNVTKSEQ